jgi:glyoxylase-like metal-dependent hydrolase (beta-lactamase superfamily II)
MRVTKHGQYLHQLTLLPHAFPMNAYLVREDDGFTLIDSTMSSAAPKILSAAESLGVPIVRIAITHAHMDHVGAIDRLHAALPQAELLFPVRDARFLQGDKSLDPAEPQVKLRGGYVTIKSRADRLLSPGEHVGSLQVVSSPGHTPGHIAFIDTRDGSLIAGDAFQTAGDVAVSGTTVWRFPFPALATWHRPTALASARTLRAMNPTRLAAGHGNVLEAPGSAIDRAIAKAEDALGSEAARVA